MNHIGRAKLSQTVPVNWSGLVCVHSIFYIDKQFVILANNDAGTGQHSIDHFNDSFDSVGRYAIFSKAIVRVHWTIVAGTTHCHVGFDDEIVDALFCRRIFAISNARMSFVIFSLFYFILFQWQQQQQK